MAGLLVLAACQQTPAGQPARPALWEVTGSKGEKAWLFGTIHALPQPVDWRSSAIDAALKQSDQLVLEVAAINDTAALQATYARLAASRGLPPLLERLPLAERAKAETLLRKHGIEPAQFSQTETWAVALTLAKQLSPDADPRFGIDREVLEAAEGKTVSELEGGEAQLGIFDRLPEADQRDLLRATLAEGDAAEAESEQLAAAWTTGNMALLEAETRSGMLADPELRAALLVNRNAAWTGKLAALLATGRKPFVAVGAAHMAGPDGLPAMLTARGYKVRRVQ